MDQFLLDIVTDYGAVPFWGMIDHKM